MINYLKYKNIITEDIIKNLEYSGLSELPNNNGYTYNEFYTSDSRSSHYFDKIKFKSMEEVIGFCGGRIQRQRETRRGTGN